MNIRITIFLLHLLSVAAIGQEFHFKQYRVAQGLPSDIIKGCAQDSLGFFWIATDEGIVKYDGVKFTSHREAMHSNYAKGFLRTRNGRLLAYGDLDIIEIVNLGDTVYFKEVCPVSRTESDSALTYPKLLYEDVNNRIWVSESQSVVRLIGDSFRRYRFDLANRSPQFLRSFTFFEDVNNDLYISSYQGNVFRYDARTDEFKSTNKKFPYGVESVKKWNDRIIIGSSEGLHEALPSADGGFNRPVMKFRIPFISFTALLDDSTHFLATRGSRHYRANFINNTTDVIDRHINSVNHVYVSDENDVWISGNDGLILMKRNLFQTVNSDVNDFIESITGSSDKIYYATSRAMYVFDRARNENDVVLDIPDGYFQSLLYTDEGVWIANAFSVFLYADGKTKKQFDFSSYGRFITSITKDSKGNIWLAIPGLTDAFMIDTQSMLNKFAVPVQQAGVINLIREGDDGMYIASAGHESYLFFKSPDDSAFRNISIPLSFDVRSNFNVTNVVFVDGRILMASSEGLLEYTENEVRRIDLGDRFTQFPVNAMLAYSPDELLMGNAFGMILLNLNTGRYHWFNESSGMLSNTITPRGLFIDDHKGVWVGTAKGLCYIDDSLATKDRTPEPRIIQTIVNGKKISLRHEDKIEYGSFLSVQVSSITFPEKEVTFQYRLLPDETWRTSIEPDIAFPALAAGAYIFEVKAKKSGPHSWSEITTMKFSVAKPFWQRGWFYFTGVLGSAVLVVITIAWVNSVNKNRNRELQQLIDERTNELRLRNEELTDLNVEKNNLIGIVAHDLKSPLKQIMGLISLIKLTGKTDEASAEYLSLMEASANKLNDMIGKILNVDAIETQGLNVRIEKIDLSKIVGDVADRYTNAATEKQIKMIRAIDRDMIVMADRHYAEQIVENLLSNAVKFSPFGRHVFISLKVSDRQAILEIRDEGPGLSEEDKPKLFGKYQRLTARPTGNEISTGLGLSIVKRLVTTMDCEVWYESELGKGASFFVSFRLA